MQDYHKWPSQTSLKSFYGRVSAGRGSLVARKPPVGNATKQFNPPILKSRPFSLSTAEKLSIGFAERLVAVCGGWLAW